MPCGSCGKSNGQQLKELSNGLHSTGSTIMVIAGVIGLIAALFLLKKE
jgi:hypothetical protein